MNYTFTVSDLQKSTGNTFAINTWKCIFATDDKVDIICDDLIFNLNRNSMFIIPPDLIYKIIGNENNYSIFEFFLDTDYISSPSPKGIELNNDNIILSNNLLKCDLTDELQTIYAQKLLELIILNITLTDSSIFPAQTKSALLFKMAVSVLKDNIATQISVEELADKLNISLSNLKRLFAKFSNFGVHDYLNLLKINKAKILLKYGHSVTETATLTGFSNQAYFSAAFKRITGTSAKEFLSVRTRTVPSKKAKTKRDLPSYLL